MLLPSSAPPWRQVRVWIWSAAFAAALLPGPGRAASSDSILAPAQALLVAGRYADAELAARKALTEIEASAGSESPDLCPALELICESGRLANKTPLDELERLAQRSLAIRTRTRGPSHPETAASLGMLARIAHTRGDTATADSLLAIALGILDRDPPPNPAELGRLLENAAALDLTRGATEKAIAALQRSLALRDQTFGPESPEAARVYCLLAQARHGQGRYQEAQELVERAIEIREKLGPADHPQLAWMLSVLSNIHLARGEFALAREVQERTLAMRIRLFGERHSEVALSLNTLGAIARRFERYPEALDYHRRAVAIQEATVGHFHPLTASYINNVAATLWMIGSTEEALVYATEALEIRERLLPPGHSDLAQSHHSLGILYDELGRNAEALEMFKRALREYEAVYGPSHPLVAVTLGKLTESLTHLERYDEASTYSTRALAIWDASESPDHPDHGLALYGHATILWGLRRSEAALRTVEQSIALYDRAHGPGHPMASLGQALRAEILCHLGRDQEALSVAIATATRENEQLRELLPGLSEEHALDLRSLRTQARDLALSLACQGRGGGQETLEQVWDLVVRSRSLVFDETMQRRRAGSGEDASARGARELYRSASESLSDLLVARSEGEEIEPDEIDSARGALEEADRRLRGSNRRFREDREHAEIQFSDVRSAMPADGALVAFIRYEHSSLKAGAKAAESETRYAAFVLPPAPEEPSVVTLGAAATVDSLLFRWRREAGTAVAESGRAGRESAYADAARELAAAIWAPIQSVLPQVNNVFLAPDGALHLVSWAALPAADGRYLAEAGPLLRLINTERDLVVGEAPIAENGRLLVLADPDFDQRPRAASSGRSVLGAALATGSERADRGGASRCLELAHAHWTRLSETAKEIDEASRQWRAHFGDGPGVSIERLERERATEENLKRLAPGCAVIHVATHAFFLDSSCRSSAEGTRGVGGMVEESSRETSEEPSGEASDAASDEASDGSLNRSLYLSGLVLAGANRQGEAGIAREDSHDDDGILTAEEIGALDLTGVSWAVLSACDSGLGQVERGEGVFGLRRAFQVAGARTVISSIWSVDDAATRAWMQQLYRARFEEGADAAEAVRAASLASLRNRRARGLSDHPFYWAAFVATGDPR